MEVALEVAEKLRKIRLGLERNRNGTVAEIHLAMLVQSDNRIRKQRSAAMKDYENQETKTGETETGAVLQPTPPVHGGAEKSTHGNQEPRPVLLVESPSTGGEEKQYRNLVAGDTRQQGDEYINYGAESDDWVPAVPHGDVITETDLATRIYRRPLPTPPAIPASGSSTPETDAFQKAFNGFDKCIHDWPGFARTLETQRDEARRERDLEVGHIHGKIGLLANRLTGISDNAPTEDCLKAIEDVLTAANLRVEQFEKAHENFEPRIVELLERCQSGQATCIFTAQIIENERDQATALLAAVQGERDEAVRVLIALSAEHDRLIARRDQLVERSVGAMAIADGDEGYERIIAACPMMASVFLLRKGYEQVKRDTAAAQARVQAFETALRDAVGPLEGKIALPLHIMDEDIMMNKHGQKVADFYEDHEALAIVKTLNALHEVRTLLNPPTP